jgi:formylglycine-generating enzyme required for sulfatase activity
MAALHARGYVVGDVNESNVLVAERSLITLVDTDSFQVRDAQTGVVYRCPVGKPEFTPPELQGRRFADVDRNPEHDQFGLAVLLASRRPSGDDPPNVPVEANSIGMHLALIPAGEFLMGSPDSEKERGSEEFQHRVRTTKPFWLGRYEVTQAQYQRVMGSNPSYFSRSGGVPRKQRSAGSSRAVAEEA